MTSTQFSNFIYGQVSSASIGNINQNINMNGYIVTNSGPAINSTDLPNLGQVQSLIVTGTTIPISTISTSYPNISSVFMNSQRLTSLANAISSTDGLNLGQANGLYVLLTTPIDQLQAPTNSLSMNSQKITNLLAATDPADAVRYDQVSTIIGIPSKIQDSTVNYVLETFANWLQLNNNTTGDQIFFINASPEWNMQTTNELNLYSFLGASLNRSYLKLGSDQITLGTTSSDILKMSSVLNVDNINNSFNTPTGYDFDQTTCQDRQFISKHFADLTYNQGVQDAIQTTTSAAYKINTLGTGITFGTSGIVNTGEFSNIIQLNDTGTQWLMRSSLPIEINTQSGSGSGIINVNNNNVKISGDIYSETIGNNAITQAISGVAFDVTTSDISRNVNKECGQMTINFTGSTNADQTFKVRGSKTYVDPSTYNVSGIVVQQDDFATPGQNYIGLFGMSIGNNELQLMINSARLDTALYDANYINLIQSQSTIPAQLLIMTPTPAASGNSILIYHDSFVGTKPLLNYTTTRFGMLNAQITTVDPNEYLTRGLADTLYTGSGSTLSLDQISSTYPTASFIDMQGYKILNVQDASSSGNAVQYDQCRSNTSIVDVLQDIPLFPNNHIVCDSTNLIIQNNNSQQIRIMGVGSNILWTASDVADVNGIQIRNLVTQGIDSTQNPISSVTSDYQYATKGYTDSVATGGIQSLIQDNNILPNIILTTTATDLELSNGYNASLLTINQGATNQTISSSNEITINSYGSNNDQLFISTNLQNQTVGGVNKATTISGTTMIDTFANDYKLVTSATQYETRFSSYNYGGNSTCEIASIRPGTNDCDLMLTTTYNQGGSNVNSFQLRLLANTYDADDLSCIFQNDPASTSTNLPRVGLNHTQSTYTPYPREFITKAYFDANPPAAAIKSAQFQFQIIASGTPPILISGTYTTVYNTTACTTNSFAQIILETNKTYLVTVQVASNNGLTRPLNYSGSNVENYTLTDQGGSLSDCGRKSANYACTRVSYGISAVTTTFPNSMSYIVKQTDSTYLRPTWQQYNASTDCFMSIILQQLD